MMLSLSSAYLKEILIPIGLIGIIVSIGPVLSAYTSKRAHLWEEKLGEKKSLLIIQIITVSSVIFMGFLVKYFGLIFFLMIPFISGFYSVILNDYVNTHVKSSHRATMLSINNMFDNIGIFIIFPILGWGINIYGMTKSYFSLAIVIAILLFFLWFIFKRFKNKK